VTADPLFVSPPPQPPAKLRTASEHKKRETGNCGGRRSVAEANPATVALAKKLARYPVNGRRRSLRDVAAEPDT
jgi:hypothetical protein